MLTRGAEVLEIQFDVDTSSYSTSVETWMDEVWTPRAAEVVNIVARAVQRRLQAATNQVFDRPTPFTQNAFGLFPASGRHADPDALVFVYDQQAQYLRDEIMGGERVAGDYATTKAGPLIPLPGANLNGYGNLPRNFIAQAIARKAFWFRPPGARGPLLAQHEGGKSLSFLAEIIPQAHYEPRLDFYGIVLAEAVRDLPAAFEAAFSNQ